MDVNEELKFLCKFKKKNWGVGVGWVGVGWVGGVGGGGLGRGVGFGGGVRVDVNEELKFLGKFTKKNRGGGSGGEGVRWGSRVGGGVRVDVNAMFGVGVMWGMGGVNQE